MFIILLILSLFTGATIEIAEGSNFVGVILFIFAILLSTQIKLSSKDSNGKSSHIYLVIGTLIFLADLIYNVHNNTRLGTLDSMAAFLGISFIGMGTSKQDIKRMGEFGAYISSIFIVLYLIFYTGFGKFNIDFLHIFDHYFVLMPTVAIIRLLEIPIDIVAIETVRLTGVEELTIVIGGPCSGLYSMFLLIGIVVGYSRIERMNYKKSFFLLIFAIFVAYISNLVRVIILYLTAYFYGYETMMFVHTHIGWIIFAVVAGSIMYIMNLVSKK